MRAPAAARRTGWPRPSTWSTRRQATTALILVAAVSFALVGTVALVVAHRVARDAALSEGLRTAVGTGRVLLAPVIPAVLAGDRRATADLEADIARRRAEGTLIRVKVWRRDGTVIWSDDPTVVGRRFALGSRERAVFDEGRTFAEISSLTDPADADVRTGYRGLVKAYIPLRLEDGSAAALEMYFAENRVRVAEEEERVRLVVFSLAGLLVLAFAQLPVSIWLMRRISRAQRDRDRMRDTALASSERERRLLARSLHDGVVQELAGAAYVLGSREPAEPLSADTARTMDLVSTTLHQAVDDLRGMLVELHPDEVTNENLGDLVTAAATRACRRQHVSVSVALEEPLAPEILAFLYRSARECAINVAKHARAKTVDIALSSGTTGVRLVVRDDGVGIPQPPPRAEGHLGLTLLSTTAAQLGGALEARGTGRGTTITIDLPVLSEHPVG
ncbi:MAG TPA: ATP-binding protein [Mycobacteriales bacterium]|nr:ATP-binding protein [Mycobacteriales bacterium]